MTNKELKSQIYSWLYECFEIQTPKIEKEKRNKLKKILEEFNPTQEIAKVVPVKVEIKKESQWKPYPTK